MKLLAGNSNKNLSKKISKYLKNKLVNSSIRKFADSEIYIEINENIRGNSIFIIQSVSYPANDNLMELLLCIDALKRSSAKNITAVIPYFGYARQDREFLEGEIITISVIGKMLRSVGTKKIVTVDIHSTKALQELKIPSENVTAITELVKYFKKLRLKNPLVVSPDIGGKQRAKDFADLLGTDFLSLRKHRDRKTGQINILTSKVAVKNRTVILVDDMISTGGSIIKSTQFLKKQKCKRVFVACTHALLVNDAEKRIKSAGVSQIISTNTVPKSTSKVDVSKIIAESIL